MPVHVGQHAAELPCYRRPGRISRLPGDRVSSGVSREQHGRRAEPQPPGSAAAIPLPVGRIPVEAAERAVQQRHHGRRAGLARRGARARVRAGRQVAGRQVTDRAERQQALCAGPAGGRRWQRPGPGVVGEGLPGIAHREYLAAGRPAADARPRPAPVGQPGADRVTQAGLIDLGIAVLPARPCQPRAVRGEARRDRRCLIGGEPPGPAAVRRREPDVIGRHEGNKITVYVREPQVSGCNHQVILLSGRAASGLAQLPFC